MLEFNPETDNVSAECTNLILKIADELKAAKIDPRHNYDCGAAMIAFLLGVDYFSSTRDDLARKRVISGGATLRCALENIIDLFYMYDDTEEYAKRYVESMFRFKQIMMNAAGKSTKDLAVSRELKQANKWTDSSIEDRLKASGPAFINVYDMFSYFSHPNPGSITYSQSTQLRDKQLNLMKQANCMTALTLMGLLINHCPIKSVTHNDLNELSKVLKMPYK